MHHRYLRPKLNIFQWVHAVVSGPKPSQQWSISTTAWEEGSLYVSLSSNTVLQFAVKRDSCF